MRRALALLLGVLASAAHASDISASAPQDLSVTVYRAPYRGQGGFDLDALAGFALISETRTVTIPAGESRLRFEGVADGIDPASAIVTGLPSGVIEKNRDAQLLSPSALLALTLGRPITLIRHLPKQAEPVRVEGRLLSDAEGGVVFESREGIEALRCSGLSETFAFDPATPGLSAHPTLSVLTRSDHTLTAKVTLTYLASGFDWSADYVATLSPDGRTLDLGAWLTLANGNGASFPDARAQVVAGRVDHTTGEVEPLDRGEPILARCWPQGSTSDLSIPPPPPPPPPPVPVAMSAMVGEVVVTAERRRENLQAAPVAQLEQLGDLKLYRAPARTTVASRQAKQVRLLDRQGTPVEPIYGADLPANIELPSAPARLLLRTRNDKAHHLGLPLPQGRIAVFRPAGAPGDPPLLIAQSATRDLAEDEIIEWSLGGAPDVQVTATHETRAVDRSAPPIPILPGVLSVSSAALDDANRVEIANAGAAPKTFELRLRLPPGAALVKADHPVETKDGRPIFRLTLAPNSTTVVRYQTGKPAIR